MKIELPPYKKVYFASDFHLGVPNKEKSKIREKKIVKWLNETQHDAACYFLVGDIFDFWFEYKHAVPKGNIRLLGKIAELTDSNIPIYIFTGNHDMWLFDYLPDEIGVKIIRKPTTFHIGNHAFYIGHGDGLGPGDHVFKLIRKIFENKFCQWLFERIHPNLGIGIANYWSKNSRAANNKKEDTFYGEKEWLIQYCTQIEKEKHHDFYIFGHRHLPTEFSISEKSKYLNLGEWVNFYTYAEYDGKNTGLLTYK